MLTGQEQREAGEQAGGAAEARRLWRDQTHPPCSVDDAHARLFQLVRRINQTRLAARRLRVLADFARAQDSRQMALFGSAADPVDAYLYLGPPELLLAAPPSPYAFLDNDFIAELHRRARVMAGGNYRDDRIEPDKVRARDMDIFVCDGSRPR